MGDLCCPPASTLLQVSFDACDFLPNELLFSLALCVQGRGADSPEFNREKKADFLSCSPVERYVLGCP